MRLWSLTTVPYQTHQEIHAAIARVLKDYDKMTNKKNLHINRRKALLRLITLPFATPALAAALKSGEAPSATASKDLLTQCSVGIGACWELRKSAVHSDLVHAFEGVSTYLPVLQRIVKDSSEHRQEAARLVMQCFLLKSLLAQHLENLISSLNYAQQALAYCEAAQDVSLHLKVFERLAITYLKCKQYQQALQAIQHVEPFLKQKDVTLPLIQRSSLNSVLARALAWNGQDGSDYLEKASTQLPEKDNESPIYVAHDKDVLLLDTAIVLSLQGESTKSFETLSKVVDPETSSLKTSSKNFGETGRIEVLNTMTMVTLRAKDKDMENAIHFWRAGIQGAKDLHSEQRFNEALEAYDLMARYIWPGEKRILELRELTQHW